MFREISLVATWAAVITVVSIGNAQEVTGFQPKNVQKQEDAGSLTDKVSLLVGFNMIKSIMRQGGQPDLSELESGMRKSSAGESQASFVAGYNIGMQMKVQNNDLNVDQMMAGIKAAQAGVDKKSFIAGYQFMENMNSRDADLNLEKILVGMKSAMTGGATGMTPEESEAVMQAFGKLIQEKSIAKMKRASEENIAQATAYMQKNKADNPDVKELPSGVQYQVLESGSGPSPTAEDKVRVDYHGTFLDGTVFDSTIKPPSGLPPQPAEFNVGEVVPGFRAALMAMKTGDKWRIVIPGQQGYGVQGRGKIGPNQALIFEVKLLEVK